MKHSFFLKYLLVFSFLAISLFAGKIKLEDGRVFEGEIIQKNNTVTIIQNNKIFQFNKKEIQEMNGQPLAKEKNPVIRIATTKGDILIELFEDEVPNTVANMITLAEAGFYKGMSFHRIISGFMVQGGCPYSKRDANGTPGTGGPGYRFADEFSPVLKHDSRGILSMANSGPNSNGSQFFITFTPTPHLNGHHAVFGKIISGMDVLDKLEEIGTTSGKPSENVQFNIEVVSKRDHEYTVKKLQ
ncbi:MAG: peptidylprolyl isomerase [Lentisphaeria bacterium]